MAGTAFTDEQAAKAPSATESETEFATRIASGWDLAGQAGLDESPAGYLPSGAHIHLAQVEQSRRAPRYHHFPWAVVIVVVLLCAAVGMGIGYTVRGNHTASSPTTVTSQVVRAAVASAVEPELVDINTIMGFQGELGAATGMVVTSSGVVVTNNHVIDGATSISVRDIGNNETYMATVVGYDIDDDIAVLQLVGASGLHTVSFANSSTVVPGEKVMALGNAGGAGGKPSVASGEVIALGQSITAADEANGATEDLSGLVETNAAIQAGDSGGPLVDSTGKVIGMNTAGTAAYFFGGGTTDGYAIPSNSATEISSEITKGVHSSSIHLGATAFLGVEVSTFSTNFANSAGAIVTGVSAGSAAQSAGLSSGDVITSVNGNVVSSPTDLSAILQSFSPGDDIQLVWHDPSGISHTAVVTLEVGPPA